MRGAKIEGGSKTEAREGINIVRAASRARVKHLVYSSVAADWMAAGIAKGSIAMALPATRRLQQIAVADIAQFTALVIERRDSFLGTRIDLASDELTVATAAAAISDVSGRHVEYTALPIDAVRQQSEDLARMMEWFDRVGYDADVVGLRELYPEVGWHRFSIWAREQDWSAIDTPAIT